ncbi:glycosyltransferase family 4 protein [Halomonas litopenaei]|uniref:glycosyltransferase family 4 protein n=1 Tax=Halomonas litopenaei TaxID=2109328 RepID=UPI001A8E7B9B|nr:glycosyltransferase family 4 protein [Halomonas litopenaei]MBN8413405.1 glycosyltransferase family 4 protein [Halomonas litopenaei]
MKPLRVIHLLDDVAPGGVMQALAIYDHPGLTDLQTSRVVQVMPDRPWAPRLEADVILTHFPPRWRALPFLAVLRARNPQARLIHVEHSYTGAWEAHCVPHRRRFRTMLRQAYRLFDDVVAVSHGQREWLEQAVGISRHRLRVISPWSDVPDLATIAPSDGACRRPLVVGAYGRFAEQKGFDRLIEAFRELDPQRYTLRLGGFGPQEAALRAAAADLPHVCFVGAVSDRAAFLAQCDVIAVPSRWEAFGLVATEARQAARALLVANVDGLPEQLGEAGVRVDFSSPYGLRDSLAALDEGSLTELGRKARASVVGLTEARLEAWRHLLSGDAR